MTGYFIRRILLIIPTFLGITMAIFAIMQAVPGGPIAPIIPVRAGRGKPPSVERRPVAIS